MAKKTQIHVSNPFRIFKDWKNFPKDGKRWFIGMIIFMGIIALGSWMFLW